MSKFQRWTKEEDDILVQAIRLSPYNKLQAIREVLEKLPGRTEGACVQRWYTSLSNPESKYYVGCMFTMLGYESRMDNRTMYTEGYSIEPIKSTIRIWNKIKKFLGLK